MALEVTDANIEEVVGGSEIVVLDFWAPWCGPCRMVGPVIEQLSEDNAEDESVAIGKINVDENPSSAAAYGVRSIPTIVFLKDGEVVDKLIGAQPKTAFQSKIDGLK